jgi:hypothetical protein
LRRGKAIRIVSGKVYDETNRRLRHKVAAADTEPAYFQQTGELRRRPYQQIVAPPRQMDAVITDQYGGWKLPGATGEDQFQRQP